MRRSLVIGSGEAVPPGPAAQPWPAQRPGGDPASPTSRSSSTVEAPEGTLPPPVDDEW